MTPDGARPEGSGASNRTILTGAERPALILPSDPDLEHLWAKSAAEGQARGESLAEHTSEVLLRLHDLLALRGDLGAALGDPRFRGRLFWAAFLHDWGKAARSFQRQVREPEYRWGQRHEVISLAFTPYLAAPQSDDERWIAAAIVSHHRDLETIRQAHNVGLGGEHVKGIELLVTDFDPDALAPLWRWLTVEGHAWAEAFGLSAEEWPLRQAEPESPAEFLARAPGAIVNGLFAYYDAVEDLKAGGDFPLAPFMLRGLMMNADHAGSAHAPPFLRTPLPEADTLLATYAVEWNGGPLHPHQTQAAHTFGSAMLIAPTGSGKTEAALAWAAAQRDPEGRSASRLFYVLPYQASMNAMRDRLAKRFEEKNVALQHGRARHALYRRYLECDASPRQAAGAASAAQALGRLNVPPIRILSPYQLLKAFYRLRGYEAILADAHGGLFILDEIHAYDVERLARFLAVFGRLARDFDARFCFMSATFPDLLKRKLREEIGPLAELTATPQTQAAFRRHRVRLLPGDLLAPAALDRIAATAAGESVLVCCNTVSRAQRAWNELRARGLKPELLHGRFNARDRMGKERRLQDRMGTNVSRPEESGAPREVMVATQVVEVSLDVDFDALYTDPAPLDALLQRMGRVNRGRRVPLRDVAVFSEPVEDPRPYEAEIVSRAVAILAREFGVTGGVLDEAAVSGWLNEVYSCGLAERWKQDYATTRKDFERSILDDLYPFQSDEAMEELFYKAFDATEVLPLSLREEYLRERETNPLGASELLVPVRWAQWGRLKRAGALVERLEPERVWVADRPYCEALGLQL